MAGYDTAGRIQNTHASAWREFGVAPAYWIRYFTPSPAADLFNDDAVAESQGAWDSGGPYVGCVSAPMQSRLGGSAAEGQADAQAFAAAMLAAYHAVGPLDLPASGRLYCWLDQEYSTSLSSDYWDAWAGYIANYNFAGLGSYPLYPCLYCTPSSPYPNCSTIARAGADAPSAIWTPVPQVCGSLEHPPSWHPEECGAVPTKLWQYGEQGACGYSSNVDLDNGAPGFVMADHCFRVKSNPLAAAWLISSREGPANGSKREQTGGSNDENPGRPSRHHGCSGRGSLRACRHRVRQPRFARGVAVRGKDRICRRCDGLGRTGEY